MNRVLATNFLNENDLVSRIKHDLKYLGYVIVSDLFYSDDDIALLKDKLINMCNSIGNVTSHNHKNTPVWDIKARDTNSLHVTFSEHADEAELHTDSQYSRIPEDHFALYCVRKSECQGGQSFFLSARDIINELNETKKGAEVLKFLEFNKYPYLVPDVFKENPLGPPEFTFGYLLKEGKMRFRIDALERALKIEPNLCTKVQVEAFNYLKGIVLNSKKVQYTYLENKECLFINNKTMLHGRTKFTDNQRHLLRVRFNDL